MSYAAEDVTSSAAQILARLNLPVEGRPHHSLTRYLRDNGFDTSHFTRNAWARGLSADTDESLETGRRKRMLTDEEVFSENSPAFLNGPKLAKRLIARGRPYRCEWCGIDSWRGTKLVLHLDHANGVNNDNRVENLRFLCPNCHSQTPTYSNQRR